MLLATAFENALVLRVTTSRQLKTVSISLPDGLALASKYGGFRKFHWLNKKIESEDETTESDLVVRQLFVRVLTQP